MCPSWVNHLHHLEVDILYCTNDMPVCMKDVNHLRNTVKQNCPNTNTCYCDDATSK